jgi:hypothetical protein
MTRLYMESFGFLTNSKTDDLIQLENNIIKFLLEK